MDKEQFYDEEIAPELAKLAIKCNENGLSFHAAVEWDPSGGVYGVTGFMQSNTSYAMNLIRVAAEAKGNIDSLLIAIMKDARVRGHRSLCLKQLGVPEDPEDQQSENPSDN